MTAVLINTANSSTSSGTSLSLNMPASIVAGRLLVAHAYCAQVPSLSGWTQIYTGTNSWTFRGFALIATGSDSGTLTASPAGAMGAMVEQYDSWSGAISDIVTATAAATDPPNDNPGVSKDWLWVALQGTLITSSGLITGAPTNYSNLVVASSGSATIANVGRADRALTASSENPGTFTFSNAGEVNPVAATMAIAPSAAVPVPAQPLVGPSQAAIQAGVW